MSSNCMYFSHYDYIIYNYITLLQNALRKGTKVSRVKNRTERGNILATRRINIALIFKSFKWMTAFHVRYSLQLWYAWVAYFSGNDINSHINWRAVIIGRTRTLCTVHIEWPYHCVGLPSKRSVFHFCFWYLERHLLDVNASLTAHQMKLSCPIYIVPYSFATFVSCDKDHTQRH